MNRPEQAFRQAAQRKAQCRADERRLAPLCDVIAGPSPGNAAGFVRVVAGLPARAGSAAPEYGWRFVV